MTKYTFLNEADAQKLFDNFPKINVAVLTEQVNELFTPYLFFHRERKDTISLWSSCCRCHGSMDKLPRTVGPAEAAIVFGKHDEKAVCPYCGRTVTLKNVSRLGKKKKLLEFHPVIFLNAKDGDLYARCYWARKDYQHGLDDPPLFMDTHALHFSIGRTEDFHEEWVGYDKLAIKHSVLEGNYDPAHRVITEPFAEEFWYRFRYCPYYVFGLEEIAASDFKYCQYEHFEYEKCDSEQRPLYSNLCKYLAAYSIYPRQIEMLMRTGGKPLVNDLVVDRRKNKNIINWNATNPCDAFGLDKSELRAFRESGCSIRIIEDYKKLRRHKLQTSFARLHEFETTLNVDTMKEIIKTCVKRNIHPDKMRRYLDRFTGPRCYGGRYTFGMAFQNWKDYTVMAEELGYDLTVETVLMPRNLDHAHLESQQELQLKQAREARETAEKEKKNHTKAQKETLARRQKKYNIEHEGYFIRIAESASEVTAEGKALVHCVGGYAERHMNGSTTILFLRRSDTPDIPLYTIQMDGNSLVQIHGYKNENLEGGKRAPNPRETMRWILDPWLEWLKKGSPRRKDGTAKLPKFKEVKTA